MVGIFKDWADKQDKRRLYWNKAGNAILFRTYLDLSIRDQDGFVSLWIFPKWVESDLASSDYEGESRITW